MRRPSGLQAVALLYLILQGACLVFLPYPYSADDVTHYLIARRALHDPGQFLHIWGRPGFTVLHALPAQFGFMGCRITSIVLGLLTSLTVSRILANRGRGVAALGFVFCAFQPYFFQLSDGALTEVVFACTLALGLRLGQKGHLKTAACVWSWGAITRLEGMPLLLVFAGWFILRARRSGREGGTPWRALVLQIFLLGVFPLVWNALCFIDSGFSEPLPIFSHNDFLNAPTAYYGQGAWYDFLQRSWVIHGPLLLGLMVIGIPAMWRRRDRLVPAYLTGFYALQSALWAGGWFATAGYDRFFVSIAPLAAIAGANGVLVLRDRWLRTASGQLQTRWAAALVLCVAGWAVYHDLADNLIIGKRWEAELTAIRLVERSGGFSLERPLVTNSPAIWISGSVDPVQGSQMIRPGTRASLQSAPAGSLVLYASFLGSQDDLMQLLDFYSEEEGQMARARQDRGLNYGHLLRHTNTRYEEVGDFSLTRRGGQPIDTEAWPYYIKVFRVLELPADTGSSR